MKIREQDEAGIELSTICRQLKLESSGGKKYETDCRLLILNPFVNVILSALLRVY
jgi:hypothetical protein